MDFLHLLHDTVCGGLAAAGFGVLFNIGFRGLPWCAASGGLGLALRTIALGEGWRMEAASFVAALAVGGAGQLLPSPIGVSRNALHVVGCIPMIPGGFAAKAILGLFAITAQHPTASNEALITALENTLRVTFTMVALGAGVAIPALLLRMRDVK
jgi:uncharacterized membrane protein YjjB (DUF3815 family)